MQFKWLTIPGWIWAVSLAILTLLSLGFVYLAFPLIFLSVGSIASRLNSPSGERRNAYQVLANGGVAIGICIIAFIIESNQFFQHLYVLSFAVAMADTVSSEIGRKYGGIPYDILKFRKIDIGLSGGISFIGSLAGFMGSAFIVFFYHILFSDNLEVNLWLVSFGFLGMVIDSIMGSLVQAKYKTDDVIKEYGDIKQLQSGFSFIDNNVVNFVSILFSCVLFSYFYSLSSL